jgi:hypothetical protein
MEWKLSGRRKAVPPMGPACGTFIGYAHKKTHQTTNLVFPNFFIEFFVSLSVQEENKLLNGPKQLKKKS